VRSKTKEKIVETHEDNWVKFEDIKEFDEWCTKGDWDGSGGFAIDTGVTFNEIKGKFFDIVHGRVFVKEDSVEASGVLVEEFEESELIDLIDDLQKQVKDPKDSQKLEYIRRNILKSIE
jgi:hypothetical protein